MTLEIAEIVLAESFLIIGFNSVCFIGFASLINAKRKGDPVK